MTSAQPLHLVRTLSEAESAFKRAVETGFRDQHQSRGSRDRSITRELTYVHKFEAFCGRPFWECTPLDMDRYGAHLHAHKPKCNTMRAKQGAVRRFLTYARRPAYPWDAACVALTGCHIPQVCTPQNTLRHQYGAETTKRRNFTRDELAALFEHIRTRIECAQCTLDQLARLTHYTLLYFALGTGARAQELVHGDLPDLVPAVTPEIATYSPYEAFVVRFGKACAGGPPRRRSVIATDVFQDAFRTTAWYIAHIRPLVARPMSPPAIFLSRRGTRLQSASISEMFGNYRNELQLSRDLTLHCFRHSFVTTLREHDYRLAVMKELLGHRSDASTLVYDHRGPEYAHAQIVAHARRTNRKLKAWQTTSGV